MTEPNPRPEQLRQQGYVCVLTGLRFSEWQLCQPLLKEGGIRFATTDNGNPHEMTGGFADLEFSLWLLPADVPRARELIGKIPAWSGGGTLDERFKVS